MNDGTRHNLSARLVSVALISTTSHEATMDPLEAQAKASIAAALIVRGAVEIPAMPSGRQQVADAAGMRLRELTDYIYRLLTMEEPPAVE
jgi:hypothetical protein